jgi:hypothetical protein
LASALALEEDALVDVQALQQQGHMRCRGRRWQCFVTAIGAAVQVSLVALPGT